MHPVSRLQLSMHDPLLSGTSVGPHLPILKLTRESSTDDNVVILRVTIKNEVLIGRVLERKSYLCPLRTGGVGATGSGRNWPGTLPREN